MKTWSRHFVSSTHLKPSLIWETQVLAGAGFGVVTTTGVWIWSLKQQTCPEPDDLIEVEVAAFETVVPLGKELPMLGFGSPSQMAFSASSSPAPLTAIIYTGVWWVFQEIWKKSVPHQKTPFWVDKDMWPKIMVLMKHFFERSVERIIELLE